MAATLIGPIDIILNQREDGHRTYKVPFKVEVSDLGGANDLGDGPLIASQAAGIPTTGSVYSFGNDVDFNAFCSPEFSVRRAPGTDEDGKIKVFVVEKTFTTLPNKRCQDEQFEDPLLEPQKVSGGFLQFTREFFRNFDGSLIKSSSHEPIRGPDVEFEDGWDFVRVEQNVADLQLALVTSLKHHLNSGVMWGLPARTIKFSNFNWEQKFFGTCDFYYTRTLEFGVMFEGWDRVILDRGTRVLFGEWSEDGTRWVVKDLPDGGGTPDSNNPAHFVRFKDQQGENRDTILDGTGRPFDGTEAGAGTATGGSAATINVQAYNEADLFQLGIPSVIGQPSS